MIVRLRRLTQGQHYPINTHTVVLTQHAHLPLRAGARPPRLHRNRFGFRRNLGLALAESLCLDLLHLAHCFFFVSQESLQQLLLPLLVGQGAVARRAGCQ